MSTYIILCSTCCWFMFWCMMLYLNYIYNSSPSGFFKTWRSTTSGRSGRSQSEGEISATLRQDHEGWVGQFQCSKRDSWLIIVGDYTILYYIILYYTILYYIILYYTILYYIILYYTILYYTILYYIILYYTILYYIILYYTILYYIILYYTILYYIILYYTILY